MSRKTRRTLGTLAILASEKPAMLCCDASSVRFTAAIEAADGTPASRPRFDILAYTGGAMRVGWTRPVVIDLAGLRAGKTTVLLGHDPRQIVGQGIATVANGQVTLSGTITGDTTGDKPAGIVAGHAKNGFEWGASVGVLPDSIEAVAADQKVTVNGRDFSGPLYVVRSGRLGEVSFVGVGADENANAKVAAVGGRGISMEWSAWLAARGLNDATLTEPLRAALRAQFDAEQLVASLLPQSASPTTIAQPTAVNGTTAGPAIHLSASSINAEIAEGHRRRALEAMAVAAIRDCDRHPETSARIRDLHAAAIESRISVGQFEIELLRATRIMPREISGSGVGGGELHQTSGELQAAAFLAAGHDADSVVAECGERTVEATQRRFGRSIGLHEIILAAATANGYVGRMRVHQGNWRELISWAMPDNRVQASGLSTIDLTTILSNVANKAMGREAESPEWLAPQIAGMASHTNFHAHSVASLAMNGELQVVAPSGELKSMSLSDEVYTRTVGTRGAVLKLSRQDIINDDLAAFDRAARALAVKAFHTREKALFSLINGSGAGASHFTVARGNYLSGTAFGNDGMAAALKAFRNLKGVDGDPIMVEPSIVLVPSSNEDAASRLLVAGGTMILFEGKSNAAASTMKSNANIYAGRFGGRPYISPWLESSAIGGSTTAWYLLADPSRMPCYEIAYLNGNQTPTVDFFGLDASFDQLGVGWRVYWDFGVAAAEWRGGVKSAGA